MLDGSIRRAGNRLRVTLAADTRTGHSVWAERYDRQIEDVFEIQDEIAQNIARALRVMLTEQEKREIEKVPTSQVQAYDYTCAGGRFFTSSGARVWDSHARCLRALPLSTRATRVLSLESRIALRSYSCTGEQTPMI